MLVNIVKALAVSSVCPVGSCLLQSTRNTFVLKRRFPPYLYKKTQKPGKLRGKHYVYDLVEDTTIAKKPILEVVLTTFVEGVGSKGDVVSLKPNIAYNKLLLPGLAVYKTPESVAKYATVKDAKVKEVHSSTYAQRTVNKLESLILAVVMNKDHPWKIEPWHIKASLRKAGYYVPEHAITLPETPITGPDLLKQNKEFYCTITTNNLEKARVHCRIHHWSTEPSDRLPYVFEHWKLDSEPLFGNNSTPAQPEDNLKNVEK
ncbi:large ribosomal subunit protein bL9m-like [Anopheles ziemanni]|uniref:large ribosomal subunit protein bL9m-like n=1 Tax=Anopheles coustani TaxID=139045 RepID=UPI00265A24D5|nr:large ribosomal subunit protein bL9m-like [Anopheles coustani]XP_058173358.1 large ribosomal subunit protein bL9m-like [Anopheles ziemanni]